MRPLAATALATWIPGSERRRPGAASVGAWSLAEEVRREARRWHVRRQHEVNRPQRTDRAQVVWCTSATFAWRPLDRQTKEENRWE